MDHQARVALFGEKHAMLRIQLLLSMITLFVRTELYGSIRSLLPKMADRVAVFEGSPIGTTNHCRDLWREFGSQ